MKHSMRILGIYIILSIYQTNLLNASQNDIALFLQPYPELQASQAPQDTTSESLNQPGYLHAKMLTHRFADIAVEGVFALYQGYITVSSRKGEILFPRKQQSNTINLLITPEIIPAFMIAPTTTHHWELNPKIPTDKNTQAMYSLSLTHDDETDAYFYNVQSVPLPDDNIIDFTTIVLLAPANMIYVPEGISMSQYSANMILPTIYVKPGIQFINHSLYALKIKNYFESISKQYNKYNGNDQSPLYTVAMVLGNE